MPSIYTIPPSVESELLYVFDKLMDSESGIVYYKCPKERAVYLKKMAEALKTESTLTAMQMLSPNDPGFMGSYAKVKIMAAEEGLYMARTADMQLNSKQLLYAAAFGNKSFTLDCKSEDEALAKVGNFRVVLGRLRAKFKKREFLDIQISNIRNVVRIGTASRAQGMVQEIPPEKIKEITERMSSTDPDETDDDI